MKNILKDRGSVYCNEGAWNSLNTVLEAINPSKIFILTDTNTKQHCLPYLLQNISYQVTTEILTIADGEEHKTIATCSHLWEELTSLGADRKSLLINLGGGVVTDLGGFVACAFKRGIEFINIPTSLLAMVDASVGGKNGVDLGTLKNQIGIIRNPYCVIIDTEFLESLPANHRISGYAEMLKHGLIYSEGYWEKLKYFDITNRLETEELIWRSVLIKNEVVSEDPYEIGIRKSLNYGHTIGHAIESYFLDHDERPSFLHGEAIAIGMILATYISSELLSFPKQKLLNVVQTILQNFPKSEFHNAEIEEIIKLLIYDKKNSRGRVFFVLLEDFGKHKTDCEVANSLIHNAFDYYKNF